MRTLDLWSIELGRPLTSGVFGENLTTAGLDVSSALIGERWKIGPQVVVEVSSPRFPCRTFAHHVHENGWMRTFIHRAAPGAYLRVVRPGPLDSGDVISVVSRPEHDVTVSIAFRALTLEPDLLPRLLTVDALPTKLVNRVRRRLLTTRAGGP